MYIYIYLHNHLYYRWRTEALSDSVLEVLLEPHIEIVARAALREARGKQAWRREAAERDVVCTTYEYIFDV